MERGVENLKLASFSQLYVICSCMLSMETLPAFNGLTNAACRREAPLYQGDGRL
jgi:hypothetical protein